MKRFLTALLVVAAMPLSLGAAPPPRILSLLLENSTGKYRVTVDGEGTDCALSVELVGPAMKRRFLLKFVGGGFVYARPLHGIGDRLVTVWESGVGLRVAVFTLGPSRVKTVLDEWSIVEPDILQCDNATDCAILYDEKEFSGQEWLPAKAKIYEWDGKTYALVRSVSYGERFKALNQLESKPRKK